MSHVTIYIYCQKDGNFLRSRAGSTGAVMSTAEANSEEFTLAPPPDSDHVWRWVDDKWVADDPEPPNVADMQEQAWDSIKTKRLQVVTSGVYVQSVDKWFHTDEVSATTYSTIAGMIALDNYEPVRWKTMDNSWLLLTVEIFKELQTAMSAKTNANYAVAEQHKAAMLEVDNPLEYDYSGNWV